MTKTTVSKIFSTSLSLALAVTSAPWPAAAAGPASPAAPSFVTRLTPPEQFGYVASSFAPKGESNPRMILISDLHAHVEVQHNIKGILQHVVGQLRGAGSSMANKAVPIFVEGGWESHLEEPLKTIQSAPARSFLAEYFLHKAEMNAAQSFSENVAGSNQVELIGVESKAEYLFNRAQFLKTYPARKALLEAIQREEAGIRDVTKVLTSRTFAHLQDLRDGYNAGRVRPETFAHALTQLARRYGISNGHVRILQNVATASQSDLDMALPEVYRSVLKAASSKRPMTAFLRQAIKNEDAVRENLARIDASLDLLKRLVGDQLTPSEVPLALMRMPELIETAGLLLSQNPLKDSASDVIHDSFNFYPFAKMRDAKLADNSLRALTSFGPDATGILITGGFHTDAIAERLRQSQISYIVIHPSITRDLTAQEQMNYINRLGGEHVSPTEIGQDIESLRRQKPAHAQQSVAAAVTDLDKTPMGNNPEETQKYLGGVDRAISNSITAADVEALKNRMESAQTVMAIQKAVASATDNATALQGAVDQVMGVVAAKETQDPAKLSEFKDVLNAPGNMFISLSGADGQYQTVAGLEGETAAALAADARDVVAQSENGRANAASVGQIHIIGIKNAVDHTGSTAKVYIDPTSGVRTIVMDQDRLKNYIAGLQARAAVNAANEDLVKAQDLQRQALGRHPDTIGRANELVAAAEEKLAEAKKAVAAFNRAQQNFMHEFTHVFDANGKVERLTVLRGLANQIAIRTARLAVDRAGEPNLAAEIQAEVQSIIAAFAVDVSAISDKEERAFFTSILSAQGLSETIANLIQPNVLSTENAAKIFKALQDLQPEKSDYQREKDLKESQEIGAIARSVLGGPRSMAQVISDLKIVINAAHPDISEADAERVAREFAKEHGMTVEEARAALATHIAA